MFAPTRGRFLVVTLMMGLLAGCAGDGPDTREAERPFDACTLLAADDARALLNKAPTKESYESGIGPGCVYRAGEKKRIGFNLQEQTLEEETWFQTIVQPVLSLQPPNEKARLQEIHGLGDAAYWLSGKTIRVLYVLDGGKAFDVYISLGSKVTPKEQLEAAQELAASILVELKSQ